MNARMRIRSGRSRLGVAVATGLVAIVAAACGPAQPPQPAPPGSPCLSGAPGQDCLGITDGSYNLTGDNQFDAVNQAIKQENDRVAALGPTVSIVYTLPVPRVPNQLSSELREELVGAHVLQRRANDSTSDLKGRPYIQIQIANLGQDSAGWKPVVDRIKEMAADPGRPGRVVGVAGLGLSLQSVRMAMDDLSQARIPMVPTRLTADGISPRPGKDGVFRIAPPNSAQVAAAASFLTTSCRPVLVEDTRADDLYTSDLASNFPMLTRAAAERSPKCATGTDDQLPVARYDSSLPGVDTALQQRTPDICQRKPDTIYYGGRGANLTDFIAALGSRDMRTCPDRITVVTSDDGLGLAAAIRQEIAKNDAPTLQNALRTITVVVTGLASPGEWGPNAKQDPNLVALAGSCNRCLATLFPKESLSSGNIIMGHDAMLTLVRATRGAVSQTEPTVEPGSVLQVLLGFGSSRPVAGASGPIGFDNVGKPIRKNIPILAVDARGNIGYQGLR